MITRPVEHQLKNAICQDLFENVSKNVIIVEGARQVGKTSLIEKIVREVDNSIFFNLEERQDLRALIDQTSKFDEFQTILENHLGFDSKKNQLIFIDEAQESSQIGAYLRFMKERWLNTRVVLTGSSMSRLFRKDQRIPVGRYVKYLITPFSFREFLISFSRTSMIAQIDNFDMNKPPSEILHSEFLSHIDMYIETGGLPEVVTYYSHGYYSQGEDWKKLRSSILAAQVDDFVRKSEFEKSLELLSALRNIANNLGFPAKYNHLHENTNVAKKLSQLLKDWHLVYEIEQKGNSSTTNFFPKRYIYDLGIAQVLRNMPFPSLRMNDSGNSLLRSQLGGVFENLVLSQFASNLLEVPQLSGWKKNSQDGVEVDFILSDEFIIPIEVKASKKIGINNFKSIISYLKHTDQKIGIIISNDMFRIFKKDNTILINLPIYLAEITLIKKLYSQVID